MATDKQIAANRQNARKSTGPKTEQGKRRSRRNAYRHGLTAETLVDVFEDPAAYRALERSINADYQPHNNFEQALVARLTALLWRLRRAVAVESGLLDIQAQLLQKSARKSEGIIYENSRGRLYDLFPALVPNISPAPIIESETPKEVDPRKQTGIAEAFMRLSERSNVIERLGRYEMRIWRQTVQTILLLNAIGAGNRGAALMTNLRFLGAPTASGNAPFYGRRFQLATNDLSSWGGPQ
jgi:hypothetical protein